MASKCNNLRKVAGTQRIQWNLIRECMIIFGMEERQRVRYGWMGNPGLTQWDCGVLKVLCRVGRICNNLLWEQGA